MCANRRPSGRSIPVGLATDLVTGPAGKIDHVRTLDSSIPAAVRAIDDRGARYKVYELIRTSAHLTSAGWHTRVGERFFGTTFTRGDTFGRARAGAGCACGAAWKGRRM